MEERERTCDKCSGKVHSNPSLGCFYVWMQIIIMTTYAVSDSNREDEMNRERTRENNQGWQKDLSLKKGWEEMSNKRSWSSSSCSSCLANASRKWMNEWMRVHIKRMRKRKRVIERVMCVLWMDGMKRVVRMEEERAFCLWMYSPLWSNYNQQ